MVRYTLLLVYGCISGGVSAFVAPTEMGEKIAKADAIVKGVVLNIVPLATDVEDTRGGTSEKITSSGFSGPNTVAIVRITTVFKGEFSEDGAVIFVPCGYNFDESPAELTKTKEYVLFLKSMDHNFYHPTTAFSTHRVEMDRMETGGSGSEIEEKSGDEKTWSFADFSKKVREAIAAGGSSWQEPEKSTR